MYITIHLPLKQHLAASNSTAPALLGLHRCAAAGAHGAGGAALPGGAAAEEGAAAAAQEQRRLDGVPRVWMSWGYIHMYIYIYVYIYGISYIKYYIYIIILYIYICIWSWTWYHQGYISPSFFDRVRFITSIYRYLGGEGLDLSNWKVITWGLMHFKPWKLGISSRW